MKHTLLYIAAVAALGAGALTACDENFEYPPVVLPQVAHITPTTTLGDFKSEYWSALTAPTTIPYLENGDTIIFTGRVCSTDESGNIFKNIIVQSRDEKGRQVAMTFSVNSYDLYQLFPFGQEVAVYASGLSLGAYFNLLQFGAISGTSMTFMDPDVFTGHVVRTGSALPAPALVDTTLADIAHINEIKTIPDSLMLWQSRLIRVEDVRFEDAGEPFAGSATADRYVVDRQGNRLNVRNSSYSDFKSEILPYGYGNVTGILSYYRDAWQVLLNDASGVAGFDNIEPEPEPVTAEPTLTADFATGAIPDGWQNLKVAGDKTWYIATFNDEKYAAMTGYKGTAPFDSWLITTPVDLDKSPKKVMSFKNQVNGYGSTTTEFKVFVMTDADPAKNAYKEVEFNKATAPASGYSGWVKSGEIDLSSFSGVVYVGFRYTATSDANYATWCIDDVVVGEEGAAGDEPVTPPASSESVVYNLLSEDLTAIPEDWTIDNIEIGSLKEVWSWKTYNDKGYLNGSAFNGGVAAESYAISPEIDLSEAVDCTASFQHAAKFQTVLKTKCGLMVREKGKTDWTSLTIPTWPEAGSWTFVSSGDIDLSAYDGKVIELAFKYVSTATEADTWEIKNLTVKGNK